MNFTKEQEQAIYESNQNIIVSAGAGSGKTAVLTARTLRILNEGTHINELLILTFTKAAAAEMKERIRKNIKKESQSNPSLAKELELIDQSYITTFDSFALSVVKKYHYLLNISKDINITDASIINMKKSELMDETFTYYYQNINDNFDKFITDFCTKDDSLLKTYILNIANKIDSLPNREDYIEHYFDNYLSKGFVEKCLLDYQDIIENSIKEIERQATKLSYLTDGSFSNELIEILTPLYNAKTIDEIQSHINLVSLPKLPRGSEDEIKAEKDKLKKLIDNLKEIINTYGNQERIKNNIYNTKPYLEAIIDIIKTFLDKIHNYKEKNNIYDFQDIAMLSIKLVKDYENVRNELSSSFKEIMIDEYQDTNDIQETFISYIENNNVYMVGDVKQSIYRFRNANPYIFKTKYDNYSNHLNGLKIDLVKNFRSREEVLKNINDIFNLIMDNDIGGAEYHESHQMVYGNEVYINEGKTNYDYNMRILEYEIPEDKKFTGSEIEIFTIAKDIQEKINSKYQIYDKYTNSLRNITYQDFVILMDRSSDFDLYKKVFEYLGIPLTLCKDEKLNVSNDIYILKNIIDYIIKLSNKEYDQEFKYDYISIARSYLYRLPDEEIFLSFKNNIFTDNQIYKDLSELSEKLSSTSIKSLLEQIIAKTNIYEKIITVGDIESFMIRMSNLLDIADNLSTLGYNIYTFRDYLKQLLESNEDMKYKVSQTSSNTVKIMTIHNSKGLEYPICYYSGLYKEFNTRELTERFLYGNKYGIISPYFDEGIHDTLTKFLYKNYYFEEEISEKIRLFYVALTRAKEQMILVLPKKEEEQYDLEENHTIDLSLRYKYRSFADIMNSIKSRLLKHYETIDLDKISLTKDYLFNNKSIKSIETTNQRIEVKEIHIPEDKTIEEEKHFSKTMHELMSKELYNNINFGLKMHENLELIDFLNPEYDLINDQFISDKIKDFLDSDLLKNIKEANIYKEYEFIYNDNNTEYHGIIDLMLEYNDHIDIIDYKLNNIEDENYINQLNGYKKYISTLTDKPINIYLYSILSNKYQQL